MDVATLESRKQQAEKKFNELETQKASIEVELNRLQGEYRVLNDLIENFNKKEEDGSKPGRPKKSVR